MDHRRLFVLEKMANDLVQTKLQIPRSPPYAVQRTRLIETLERDVPRYKLTLLAAPAGYGKTTQLAQWAQASHLPIVWLSIDEEDNNIDRLLRYVLKGWEEIQPDIATSPLGVLLGALSPNVEAVFAAFINATNLRPDQLIFILDDYHLIKDEATHEGLTFLLDHAPPNLHFVLAARGEPTLPLARYRARGELLELRADDLRFQLDETQVFLNDRMRLELSPDEIQSLHSQLEGWIAGLQLAALTARQERAGRDQPIVSGRHRFIADYLGEDVLDRLPSTTQDFLLQTSILDRLCASLCDTVTGETDGQRMLESLERVDLFLVALDETREWFRYHRLFAEFLQAELPRRYPERVPELHCRAARWYLQHDQPEVAFQHAVAGEGRDIVALIFERYLFVKLMSGEVRTVQRWLDSLPAAWLTHHPMIVIARAGVFMVSGQFDECLQCLDEVDRLALTADTEADRYRARVMALRCNLACFQNNLQQAETLADKALQVLPEDDLDFRAGVYGALGDTYRRNGRWDEAQAAYRQLLNFTHTPGFQVQAVHLYGALADLDLRQGHLRHAAHYWREALSAIQQRENWGRYPLPLIGWVYIRLGELTYEWNQLEQARDYLAQGVERAELGGDVRALIAGYLVTARLKLAEGDIDQAAAYLARAQPLVEHAQFPDWTGHCQRFQLELWLAQDQLGLAVDWVKRKLSESVFKDQSGNETIRLAMACVLIAAGEETSLIYAQQLLDRLIEVSREEGRLGIHSEALALRSLMYWKRNDQAQALTAMEQALHMAEPEGYVRLFVDLGPPMDRLLQVARSREVMLDYVTQLLDVFGEAISADASADHTLTEPITEREADVLKLMSAGLTNREIAERLVISPGTVKRHTANIYDKLHVHTRTEAAAKARALNLLD